MKKIRFGELELPDFPVGLAPMAGVSDQPYRRLAKEFGCDWLVSEMVSAKGLLYKNEKTWVLTDFLPEERPYGVQLFGSDPEILAEAARQIEALKVDFIDLNMGCPMPKIVNNGEGSALMKTPELAEQIVMAMVKAIKIPLTVKIRLGWSQNTINGAEVAKRLENAGASMIVVHGRTREDFYMGQANWQEIAKIKKVVQIPVIGNGDVFTPEDGKRIFEVTGCDGIQVGRGAQGNPWIFKQIKDYFKTGRYEENPSWDERWPIFLRHLELLIAFKGEVVAVKEMRSHGAWYTKGLRGAAHLRQAFSRAQSLAEYRQIGEDYRLMFDKSFLNSL